MVVRRDFGSYRQADANGDSRAARVQYRLGRAAALLETTGIPGARGDRGPARAVVLADAAAAAGRRRG